MKRRGVVLTLILLIVLLAGAFSAPVDARTPPRGPEDYQYSHTPTAPAIGDDDDDGANITSAILTLVSSVWNSIRWLGW
jgi:hypothetical protein